LFSFVAAIADRGGRLGTFFSLARREVLFEREPVPGMTLASAHKTIKKKERK
jgi:hypothetical protein